MNGKNFLLSIDTKKIKYGLLRTKQLLEACNNPQKKIKSIQIIGTNGKGTIAAMLNNVLINNGYKTGLFTSPHLVSFNERISINYKKIPESFINSFIKKYKKSIEFIKPSFFEIMTVMGIYYFQQKRVDFAILETGLGGRLDSVTAANAEVAIFTSISYDHTQILGKQLSDIAYEKTEALSKKTQLILSDLQHPIIQKILNKKAKQLNKNIYYLTNKTNPYNFNFRYLKGIHQRQNGELVKQTIFQMKTIYQLSILNICKHISTTHWPGRVQLLSKSPDVLFDVAHNNSSIRAFMKYYESISFKYKKCYLICGFEEGKDIKKSLQELINHFNVVIITETNIRKSMHAKVIAKLLQNTNHQMISIQKNPKDVITITHKNLNKNDLLVILGSHYFGPYLNRIFKNCFEKP